ncbi:prepilin-type N-terminal cleavage/methylation domain-containing protein [Moraxella bovis]|uniref:prepilin-type N-terminal cleavage/methylation domain-containing protein n=1 Tax=Moraxella bovis TaxID=476 RepID=UPI0022274D6F|nr:prepilin-type N-terminal cleavage/methylation domain-containing protein [Moraxella bovis]UYZ68580.1 prepilin-type N-terminal cleavage/methylation domain-containing protein [Moraxella bovis]UYZ95341.1 prepilin-type N-terminal cleavage/methylation domain-containing protein [Moraxella bovis]UZA06294.1 prepilin-type N-terminal cleavage/methylation domain-containing protein [Moraxella bovis]UZA11478.1 prepilin-type N-terminal cleavage/methylation domain-containing protein [Moraxella bovis]UZA273
MTQRFFVKHHEQGFTLLELIIVVIVVAILASIALPNYRNMVVRNAESEVQSTMGRIQVDLDRWRASAMTYRGFVPVRDVDNNGRLIHSYGDNNNTPNGTVIFVPLGSNQNNFRYRIELRDGDNTAVGLNPAINANIVGSGRSWVMHATPNPNNGSINNASAFVLRSTGFKCKSSTGANPTVVGLATTTCNAAGQETW